MFLTLKPYNQKLGAKLEEWMDDPPDLINLIMFDPLPEQFTKKRTYRKRKKKKKRKKKMNDGF